MYTSGTAHFVTGGLAFAKMLEKMLELLIWCQSYKTFFVTDA
jgi:hypothetical protein